ncbi:ribosomal RNA small subunit methyltransferase B [Ruminiclostridium hungatei]|uniref:16S rRNA (cytosine(967)-C(5))-methyltransferase n=1 Tax=Ruminiclostridium hungatei TaxID=48256 RepID=A0A1V4SEL6_RUMHU|nr:16S rRNA (cytosine(967)-C(5))-methyltransferase RsmB [Ruminiclostridium hungatei]OPX42349.1 ribosomal RNA small subunit methyltransferase B [Ruminiclostridium hungatei]
MAIDPARETALKILYDINENEAYSNISVNKYLEAGELREIDRAFATELAYGTVKWLMELDYIIDRFSSVKAKKLSPWIKNILRLGIYQLLHTDKIPSSAACNTSVDLAKRYGHQASSRFVNAVLRNIARSRDSIPYPEKKDNAGYLSIVYSHPRELVDRWLELFGGEFTEALLKSNNTVPDFNVRVNTLKTTPDELLEALRQEGCTARLGNYLKDAVVLENPSSISRLEAFKKGYFTVQDESSMLASVVLEPAEGQLAVDVCSAPGGKATHLAQLMNNRGTVLARDIHEHKLRLVEGTAARMGIGIVKTQLFDAAGFDESLEGKADRVLVDAPCTGFGIIRKKPDIKYSRNLSQQKEIVALQKKVLDNAARYVKPGGCLVYSTCTIQPEENLENVKAFLGQNRDYKLADFEHLLPEKLKTATAQEGYIQLYPNTNQTDGFFISKLVRVK